jgi:23S rRNA pseudouridine1911/1915/1917 synthase
MEILYEDKDILVINKPSGIMVHSDGRKEEKTISDFFIEKYPKAKNVGESIFVNNKEIKKPGIVHRLDKDTSGVLLLAKNSKAFDFLKEQFINHQIKKIYEVIVSGWVKNDRGIIDKPIGRSPSDFRRRLAGRGARGELKEAITEYKVLNRFIDKKNNKYTFLEIKLKTGRTHQIRVHMKYLNHPVICDFLYNPKGFCPKKLSRIALHAKIIEFKNLKNKIIKIEVSSPKEFENFINLTSG